MKKVRENVSYRDMPLNAGKTSSKESLINIGSGISRNRHDEPQRTGSTSNNQSN